MEPSLSLVRARKLKTAEEPIRLILDAMSPLQLRITYKVLYAMGMRIESVDGEINRYLAAQS